MSIFGVLLLGHLWIRTATGSAALHIPCHAFDSQFKSCHKINCSLVDISLDIGEESEVSLPSLLKL